MGSDGYSMLSRSLSVSGSAYALRGYEFPRTTRELVKKQRRGFWDFRGEC